VGLVRVGRVQRHSPRAKPAAVAVGGVGGAVSSWATRVGGSAHAWRTDSRAGAVIDCRLETCAQTHGKGVKRVDVKVNEGELTVGV